MCARPHVTYNWLHELMQFAPELQAIVIDGGLVARQELLLRDLADVDVVITSYPLLRRDITSYDKLTVPCGVL